MGTVIELSREDRLRVITAITEYIGRLIAAGAIAHQAKATDLFDGYKKDIDAYRTLRSKFERGEVDDDVRTG